MGIALISAALATGGAGPASAAAALTGGGADFTCLAMPAVARDILNWCTLF